MKLIVQRKDTVAEGRERQDLSICCPHETHFSCKDEQTESEGMEKIFHANKSKERHGSYPHIR